jgi:tetratricopeptide (TPR) repeat protein
MTQRHNHEFTPSGCNTVVAPSHWWTFLAAAVLVGAGIAAYWNSFEGTFVLDDFQAIVRNPTIRSLWPPGPVFTLRQGGSPVTGRPVVNLSLAVNRALSGTEPWGYHAANLAIHILAGLALFGIIRRTLILPRLRNRFGRRSTKLALAVAMIWLVHPLQTESVTYVCQRAESLAGLLYLATMYCCLRAFQANRGIGWQIAGVALCLVGMATKETVATAPLVVLLYDRTFLSPSFREAIRRRWGLYASLAATWALLVVLLFQSDKLVGLGQGISPWDYPKTQFEAIIHYLRLCFWPNPLVLHYAPDLARGTWQIVPQAIAVALLLIATLLSMRYLPWAGFLGACFFLILSPTSSFVPIVPQPMAEHRMYLPLAAVAVMVVMLTDWAWGRLPLSFASLGRLPAAVRWAIPVAVVGALVAGETYLTVSRNNDYRSNLSIWQDTVRKAPSNYRARNELGAELAAQGQVTDAIEQYRQALKLKPDFPEAHNNLGITLASQGRATEAIEHYRQALKSKPDYAKAHNNLGAALASRGQVDQAIEQFQQALKSNPDFAMAHYNLGNLLTSRGQVAEAIEQYRQALKSKPDYVEAHNNLGNALASRGQVTEAIEQYQQALRFNPDFAEAHNNLGNALASRGQVTEAIEQYQQALKSEPDYAEAHNDLGIALASRGQVAEAIAQYQQALWSNPDFAEAHNNLGNALASQGQFAEAVEQYQQALKSKPNFAEAHNNLGRVLAAQGRLEEAIHHFEQSLRLKPDYAIARENLNKALAQLRTGRPASTSAPNSPTRP